MKKNSALILFLLFLTFFFVDHDITHARNTLPIRTNLKKSIPNTSKIDSRPVSGLKSNLINSPTSVMDWSILVFQSSQDGNPEIYSMKPDRSQLRRLTNHPASDANPHVTRDSSKIVFESNREDNLEIYSMDIDGSRVTRLTFSGRKDSEASWSSDGARIVFVSERDSKRSKTNPEIYTMNADGSNQIRLTFDPWDEPSTDIGPAWSPDGTRIAWIKIDHGIGWVWMMNANGSNKHSVLLSGYSKMTRVVWIPNGQGLAADMDIDRDGDAEVFVFAADGMGGSTMYNPDAVDAQMSAISPNSEWYAVRQINPSTGQSKLIAVKNGPFGDKEIVEFTGQGSFGRFSWGSLDVLPPISQFTPLPNYSRASGFGLEWTGHDVGPAGLVGFETAMRLENRNWSMPPMDYTETDGYRMFTISGEPGDKYYFRSRAWDEAGNYELYPDGDQGDTHTTFYTYQVSGRVTDNRGYPIQEEAVGISPVPLNRPTTNISGNYSAWLSTTLTHSIQISREGYADFSPLERNIESDQSLNLYLHPKFDYLSNGSFESGWDQWIPGGYPGISLIDRHVYRGNSAASLGFDCDDLCTTVEKFSFSQSTPALAIDSHGLVHIAWYNLFDSKVYYRTRTSEGLWSPITTIMENAISSGPVYPSFAVGPDDTLHLAIDINYMLFYTQKPIGGSWSTPINFASSADQPRIAIDSTGTVFIVYRGIYSDCVNICFVSRTPSGFWSNPIRLDAMWGYIYPDIAVGLDDTIYFIWHETIGDIFGNPGDLNFRTYRNGFLSETEKIATRLSDINVLKRMVVDHHGVIHVTWTSNYYTYYSSRSLDGTWSFPIQLDIGSGSFDLALDETGKLHVIATSSHLGFLETYYLTRSPEGIWSMRLDLNSGLAGPIQFDEENHIHWVYRSSEVEYRTTAIASTDGEDHLSRKIEIPLELHKPTLAGMYRLANWDPSASSYFNISISDGIQNTDVYSTNINTDWNLTSIDLDQWAGQTVTVTYAIHQAGDEPYSQLMLDDFSLGDWETPLVTSVYPNQIENYFGAAITISGKNFIPTPAVFIGDSRSTFVQWLDENTLQVLIPDDAQFGLQDITVINPGGQSSFLTGGLYLGYIVFLPVAVK